MPAKPIFLSDVRTFFSLVYAVLKGQYKMPWGTFFWCLLCGVYVLSPIDALPDVLPLLGFADDGAFVVFVLLKLHGELVAFRQHRTQQETILEAEIVEDKKDD